MIIFTRVRPPESPISWAMGSPWAAYSKRLKGGRGQLAVCVHGTGGRGAARCVLARHAHVEAVRACVRGEQGVQGALVAHAGVRAVFHAQADVEPGGGVVRPHIRHEWHAQLVHKRLVQDREQRRRAAAGAG